MNERIFIVMAMIAGAILLPEIGFAADLLEGKLGDEMKTLTDTLFGFPIKIAGVLAGAYGLLQCYIAASPKPLMMWGAVSLLTFFMPKILTAFCELDRRHQMARRARMLAGRNWRLRRVNCVAVCE